MFSPKYFQMKDHDEVIRFMEEHSFVTIVTMKKGDPIATHVPVQLQKEGEDYFITGHLAYSNPQWRTFELNKRVLVIYQGPHAYISSSWYSHENVPTWNYQAVHIYGQVMIMGEQELKADLAKQLEKYEKYREHPTLWHTLSPELLEQQLKGIVGFKIKVEDIQATYKLSQNRNDEDYQRVVENLQQEDSMSSQQLAEVMKKIGRNNQ
ncbi:FMN-binding negative transcriptional regulator [Lysinibacillus sp. LZ02]|uniref:FMN-binding negative transcriptional regulator n=1 Tax=Lysinibacillus sp. LZ02 TaxID=3420668 RepID=UPI003D36D0C0